MYRVFLLAKPPGIRSSGGVSSSSSTASRRAFCFPFWPEDIRGLLDTCPFLIKVFLPSDVRVLCSGGSWSSSHCFHRLYSSLSSARMIDVLLLRCLFHNKHILTSLYPQPIDIRDLIFVLENHRASWPGPSRTTHRDVESIRDK